MLPMTHDEAYILHGRRQIARRDFRHTQDVAVAPQADGRIDPSLQIVRIRRFAEQIDRHVSRPMPGLILQPADHTGPDMTGHAFHFFVR